jgi:hypothetical protein
VFRSVFSVEPVAAAPVAQPGGVDTAVLQTALAQALGSVIAARVEPTPQVDYEGRLRELGLEPHFPEAVWPPANAAREVVFKVAQLKRRGVRKPFFNADLKKFLHSSSAEALVVLESDDGTFGAEAAAGRRLELAVWLVAWDGYAIAAACIDQMSFRCATVHKHMVCKVAFSAGWRKPFLGVLFDEVSRHVGCCRVFLGVCSFL